MMQKKTNEQYKLMYFPFKQAIQASQTQWQYRLIETQRYQHIKTAAKLLCIFCQGIKDEHDELIRLGQLTHTIALPIIAITASINFTGINYDETNHAIIISTNKLAEFGNHNPTTCYYKSADTQGSVDFTGTIHNFWFLSGVEEFTHAVDLNLKAEAIVQTKHFIPYYATPHEYKALIAKINAAKRNKFNPITIDTMIKFLKKVEAYKKSS